MEYIYLAIAGASLALNVVLTIFLIKNTKNMKAQSSYNATETMTLNPTAKRTINTQDAGIGETVLMDQDEKM